MKQTLIIIFMVLILTACGGNMENVQMEDIDDTESLDIITEVEEDSNDESDNITEVEEDSTDESDNIIFTDPLSDLWFGKWVCVYSEANYFKEGEMIFVKDFDNAVLYTKIIGDDEHENNRWFFYDKDTNIIDIYNEPPPFKEDGWIRDSFEIKKESENEIVMTRLEVGQEVRFEKLNNN